MWPWPLCWLLTWQVWMCGGTLEIIPCSHVGHIFRKRSPYSWSTDVDVVKKNSVRLAEVWMDDYKKFYYERFNYDLVSYSIWTFQWGTNRTNNIDGAEQVRVAHNAILVSRMRLATIALLCKQTTDNFRTRHPPEPRWRHLSGNRILFVPHCVIGCHGN